MAAIECERMASEMNMFDPPSFCRKVVCVTDDPALAATVCSALGDAGEYVAIVRRPRNWHPMVRIRDFAQYANTIQRIQPDRVFLLGVDAATSEQFTSKFGSARIISANTVDDALLAVRPYTRAQLSGVLRCRPQDVGLGLLLAKRQKRLLFVDEVAPQINDIEVSSTADHVVAIDDDQTLSHIVAANYAFSIGADLVSLPPRANTMREAAYGAIDARSTHNGTGRGLRAGKTLEEIDEELRPALELGRRTFVTFITKGLPYGYFYREGPSTHLLASSMFNSIVTGIHAARHSSATTCALLIDPGDFADSETPEIARTFREQGTVVVELPRDAATVNNARLFIGGLPYDLLFICSHCGELDGTRVVWRVPDRNGIDRMVEVDIVAAVLSNPRMKNGTEMVLFSELFIPISVDGTDWFAVPADLRTDFWDFMEAEEDFRKRDIVRSRQVERVAHSTAIKLHDGNLSLSMDIEVGTSPIVFNNSCVSFFDAADALTHAGARGYIGTLAPVEDRYARDIAIEVIGSEESRKSLPLALYHAQRKRSADQPDLIYVHVGCHFNRVSPPGDRAHDRQIERVREALGRWRGFLPVATGHARDQAQELVEFLSGILGGPNT